MAVTTQGYSAVPRLKKGFTVSNALMPFDFHGNSVRVIMVGDRPTFVATDVATALEFSNPSQAIASHVDPEDRGLQRMETSAGTREVAVVTETGLYALIFGSRKAEAKKFRKWVFEEVLPTIRRTGGYVGRADVIGDRPDDVTQRAMRDIEILKAAKELMSPQALEAEALRAVRRGLQFAETEASQLSVPETPVEKEFPQVMDLIGVMPEHWVKHIAGLPNNAKLQDRIITVLADHAYPDGLTESSVRRIVTARWYPKGKAPDPDNWGDAWHRVISNPITVILSSERWALDLSVVVALQAECDH